MAEYSRRLSRSRSRGQQGSTQGQNDLGMVMKPADGSAFGQSGEALVANIGGNLEGELNGGSLTGEFLPQSGDGMTPFTWCEQCGTRTEGECLIHGSVIMVSDNKLPSRARLSLPSILSLQQVNEGGGREGVFAKNVIQARTQFGPLEAPLLQAGATLPPGVFDVRVLKTGQQEQLDLSQEELCNWMMFVRPSQYDQDTNLVAYQQATHIFYISTKESMVHCTEFYGLCFLGMLNLVEPIPIQVITPKTELRVWYFRSYGQQIGKEPLPPLLPPSPILPEMGEEPAELSSLEDQGPSVLGVGTRHSAEVTKHTCTSCNVTFRSLTLLWEHNCRVLDDHHTVDTSSRPARRKGRPRKVAGVGKRGRPVAQVVSNAVASTTVLPSVTTLIKTEIKAEVPVPDSTVPDIQQKVVARKRGRPKGSKNKLSVDGTAKPPRKPPVAVKQQRPKLNCSYCERCFYSKEQHKVHEAEHTGEKPYVCPFKDCGKGFGSCFKFRRHYLVHEQPQDRKCPFCDRRFNRVDHLKNHVATHNSNRQHWSCKKCGKKYLYHGTYEYHMAIHDAREAPQLVCRICSNSFTNREALLEHVHTHNRYKPDQNRSKCQKCPKCDKTFTTIKDVRRHMVTHTKDRSFLCDMCPQTFARKDHLKRHKRSNHKDEGLAEDGSMNVICTQTFKSEPFLTCAMDSEVLKGVDSVGVAKVVEKQQMVMDTQTSKVVLMQVSQQQEGSQQQQQLSLLTQPPNPTAAITPMQLTFSQHHHHHHQQQQQEQQQHHQQQQILLQATLPAGTEAQTIEVIADGNDQYHPTLPLKTIPYRLPAAQVLAAAPSAPNHSFPITPSLRQILSNCQPQQQQQQTAVQQPQQQQLVQQQQQVATQAQPIYSQQDNTAASTIMSMLASSRGDSFLELAGKGQPVYAQDPNGQLKPLSTQWVLAENSVAVTQDSSAEQTTTDSGDHCYATGAATSSSELKLSLLQSYQLAGSMGGNTPSTSIQPSTAASLQAASWDNISELVTAPFQDMITPMSASQPSIINLPVTVNVPITGGSVSVTAPVTLSQAT